MFFCSCPRQLDPSMHNVELVLPPTFANNLIALTFKIIDLRELRMAMYRSHCDFNSLE